jgi:hypothetical protein
MGGEMSLLLGNRSYIGTIRAFKALFYNKLAIVTYRRICCAVFLLQLLTPTLYAQSSTVTVSVTAVDAKNPTITVTYDGKSRSLELAKDIVVEIDGKKSEYRSLIPGDDAEVTYDKAKAVLTKIVVQREPLIPAENLPEGWDEIDQRLVFLMVRLANVEASLDAIEDVIGAKDRLANSKLRDSKRADRANEDMDRNAGGPLKWSQFYGTTAEKFFYHPIDRNSSYHTVTVLNQQGYQADNKVGGGVPSSQGLPVHQRPPQFDYIYRSNERAKTRAVAEAAELRGKLEQLAARRQRLEAEQAGLWVEIAFRAIAHYDLDKKPLYRFEPLLLASDTDSRNRIQAVGNASAFMCLALSIMSDAERNQASTFVRIKPSIAQARKLLFDSFLNLALDITDKESTLGKFAALAKRLDDVAANLSDSYLVAMEGDAAKDDQRKELFRMQLQQSLLSYAQIVLAMDEMASSLQFEYAYKPDTTKPIQLVGLRKTMEMPSKSTGSYHSGVMSGSLSEINQKGANVNPSLTSDFLQLVWQVSQSNDSQIFYSTRSSTDQQFQVPKQIARGLNGVISSDGSELYFFDPRANCIMKITRRENAEEFGTPIPADGLCLRAYPTAMSKDGLSMYVDLHPPEIAPNESHAHVIRRFSLNSPWMKPQPIRLLSSADVYSWRLIGVSPIVGSESELSGMLVLKKSNKSEEETIPVILSGSNDNDVFSIWKKIAVTDESGNKSTAIRVFNPRINRNSKELVFQSRNETGVQLWINRNFED